MHRLDDWNAHWRSYLPIAHTLRTASLHLFGSKNAIVRVQ